MNSFSTLHIEGTGGVKLHVRRSGEARSTCVLIHGFGDGAYVWDDFRDDLPASFSAFAIDLRGHGQSEWSPNGEYATATHVADVIRVLDSLDLDRIVLVGHSLGGDVALRIAAAHPGRIVGLALVDFGPDGNTAGGTQMDALLSESLLGYDSADEYLQWLIATRPLASVPLLRQSLAFALERTVTGRFRPRFDPAILPFHHRTPSEDGLLWAMLRRVRAPTLVLRGIGSAVLTRTVAERMTAELHRGMLRAIERAGHAVMLDNPDAFKQNMHWFLDEVSWPVASRQSRPREYPSSR